MLVAGLVLAWWFNRGRAFVVALSILGGVLAWDLAHTKAVYTLVVVLVPLNILLSMVRPERGARYRASYAWFALLILEAVAIYFVAKAQNPDLSHWALKSPPIPLVGRVAFAAAFAAAVWRAWPDYKPLPVGLAGALLAFFIAGAWGTTPGTYAAFMSAAGLTLVFALLQESHQLAFRDPLTGLPGRRALEERLRALGGHYAIAMVDVDHFKKFNDTHGHDIGDQVLKLVGGRLSQAAKGGVAYRYGGEEFSVLFPGASVDEAARELDDIRNAIETYKMVVRSPDRPKQADEGAKRRGEGAPDKQLSVTVSIGVAGPAEGATPQHVIKAADEALYRAKQGGRNRVSR
ncbi:MAG TPA: GGDEF domain-containing protein [Burkholderiales bacterium]|nr:GGDEF domain-containing protein [Burkholderiales bacterium]